MRWTYEGLFPEMGLGAEVMQGVAWDNFSGTARPPIQNLICPAERLLGGGATWWAATTYGWNPYTGNNVTSAVGAEVVAAVNATWPIKIARVVNPSEKILMTDGYSLGTHTNTNIYPAGSTGVGIPHMGEGTNVLYVGGNAELIAPGRNLTGLNTPTSYGQGAAFRGRFDLTAFYGN